MTAARAFCAAASTCWACVRVACSAARFCSAGALAAGSAIAGLALAAAMMAYHYRLIRGRSRAGCFKAFQHNNWVGAAVLGGIIASYSLR